MKFIYRNQENKVLYLVCLYHVYDLSDQLKKKLYLKVLSFQSSLTHCQWYNLWQSNNETRRRTCIFIGQPNTETRIKILVVIHSLVIYLKRNLWTFWMDHIFVTYWVVISSVSYLIRNELGVFENFEPLKNICLFTVFMVNCLTQLYNILYVHTLLILYIVTI